MARQDIVVTPELAAYIRSVSLREPPLLARLREETAALPRAHMQVSPEQGQLLGLLAQLVGAKKALEIGVFTGYSSLSVALRMPPGGRLYACDISDEFTRVARRYWAEAGVADRIELRLGPALDTLDALLSEGHRGSFDFAFIDADKSNYRTYYERALDLVRPGGLIAVDNVLWSGRVIDPADQSAETLAMRAFNQAVHDDARVDLSLVAAGDGVTLAVKL